MSARNPSTSVAGPERKGIDPGVLARARALFSSVWLRPDAWKAWIGLAVVLAVTLGLTGISGWQTFIQRTLLDAAAGRHPQQFYSALLLSAGVGIAGGLVRICTTYLTGRLVLWWRTRLTQQISDAYLRNRAFYKIQRDGALDNPDERISEDAQLFTTTSSTLFFSLFGSVASLFVFVPIMNSVVGGWPTAVIVVYVAIMTFAFFRLFGRVSTLNEANLRIEADYRYGLMRVRENAESIAFYRGESQERESVTGRFRRVVGNILALLRWNFGLGMANNVHGVLIMILPVLYAAILYFQHRIDIGATQQITYAVTSVAGSLSLLIESFGTIAIWAAQTNRLSDLRDTIERTAANAPDRTIAMEGGDGVSVSGLAVATPSAERVLVRDLSFNLSPKDSLVITGPVGSGKSSLLRVLAGLWDATQGAAQLPPAEHVMFLSAKVYMPHGDLRQQIAYPSPPDRFSDEQYREWLEDVGLADLTQRFDLHAEVDWSQTLSPGEQQRVAVARVLANAPAVVMIDEGTSALDSANESRLYTLLKDSGIGLISVAHRETLLRFHDKRLELGLPDAGWRFAESGS